MKKKLVSIIIPTFNRAHLIGETLDSVLAQTYTHWECIIVDDESTDDTEQVVNEYLKKDKRFQYFKRPTDRPKGGNAARNYGFEVSKGEFIQWFDSDDIMADRFLSNKLRYFNEGINFVLNIGFCELLPFDELNQLEIIQSDNLFKEYLLWRIKVITSSPMFNRAFLEGKVLFNTKLKRGQETELFSRLFFMMKQSSYVVIKSPDIYYRQHEGSISSKAQSFDLDVKKSQSFVFVQNLNLVIKLNDSILFKHVYDLNVNILFDFFRNGELKVLEKNIKKIFKCLNQINRLKALFFLVLITAMMKMNLKGDSSKRIIKKIF